MGGTEVPLRFLGRQRELAVLLGAMDAAHEGHGSLVMLAGEPGIGKTTLAGALADAAAEHGAPVIWGRAWSAGGAPAYWPWRQVVRKLAADLDDKDLAELCGPEARWLVRVAPEIDSRLPGEDPIEPVDSDQARFSVYDALATFLSAYARRAPLVIVLDDLHAADTASVRALDFIAQALVDAPVLIVVAFQDVALRARPDVRDLVAGLDRHGERVELGALPREAVGALLARRAGGEVSAAVVDAVYERTEGNPLYIDEMARALAASGDLEAAEAPAELPLPQGVREGIRRRIADLGPETERVLTAAAVIGQDFDLPVLERATRLARPALLDVLEEAEGYALVTTRERAGEYRFAHGLIRETLYVSMSAGERMKAHQVTGEALEAIHTGEARELRVAELAHHFLSAAPLGETARAIEYSHLAGRDATESFAFEEAAEHLDAALSTLEREGSEDRTQITRLRIDLGLAQHAAGIPRARDTLLVCAQGARALGDSQLLTDVALAFGPYALSPGVVDDVWVSLLEEALASIEEDHTPAHARLLARLGRAQYFRPGSARRRAELAQEAISLAHAIAEPRTIASVLSDVRVAIWGPDNTAAALDVIAELEELLEQLGDRREWLPSLVGRLDLYLELGDLNGVDIVLAQLEALAIELNDIRAQALVKTNRARRAIVDGRFDDARPLMAAASALAANQRDSPIGLIVGGQEFTLRLLQGGLEELEPMLRANADSMPGMPVWRAGLARTLLESGREAQASHELERASADDFSGIERDSSWLMTLAQFAEVAVAVGDVVRGERLRVLMTPFSDRMITTAGGVFLGPVARVVALLEALTGDVNGALARLAPARAHAEGIGARPSVVLVDLAEAEILIRAGDAEAAKPALARARDEAVALGMEPIRTRAEALGAAAPRALRALAPEPDTAGRMVCEGDVWTVELGARSVRLRDGKGVRHLAVLLAHPGVEMHAVDLVTGMSAPAGLAAVDDGLDLRADTGDAGAVLDDVAKRAYRERIGELREDLEEAERFHDTERAARLREELDDVAAQLAGAVGLGGRDRRASSTAERARVNVTRAIRSTLRKISEHEPALGGELEATISTGTYCSYEPSKMRPIEWKVDLGRS